MMRFSVMVLPAASWAQEVAPLPSHMEVMRPLGLESVRAGGAVAQPLSELPSKPYCPVGVAPSL